jgi:hypothetical protein
VIDGTQFGLFSVGISGEVGVLFAAGEVAACHDVEGVGLFVVGEPFAVCGLGSGGQGIGSSDRFVGFSMGFMVLGKD